MLTVVSIGLGLATLGAVAMIEGNLNAALLGQMPKAAPIFYFIDIQNNEVARFRQLTRSLPGIEAFSEVPMMGARVVAVNGVPAARVPAIRETRWTLGDDLGLTNAARPPSGNRITAGRWWLRGLSGSPLVSLDARLASGWGVGVGSVLTVNVLGRTIRLRVASQRRIAWRRLGPNFFLVASPGLLSGAPQTHIATVRAAPGREAAVLAAVTDALPNVSATTVADVLAAVARIFGQIASALAALGGLALTAGLLVLAGAVASEERRRTRQSVILKTLGATSGQIRRAWLVGFALEGAVAGGDRRVGGNRGQLRGGALPDARTLDFPAGAAGRDRAGCDWAARRGGAVGHKGGASRQGGAVAEERVAAILSVAPAADVLEGQSSPENRAPRASTRSRGGA
ncbi:MAG: hypothetical protein M0002_13590 [Rhodospirillales bacterium]|nr:hypothetical protein [Rhodospirillales bacterium]